MQTNHSTEKTAADITALPALNKSQLLKIWDRTFPSPPPPKLRKELMVPILAYRMQETVHGGLSHTARKRLQQLMEVQDPASNRATKRQLPAAKAASKLVRSWHGEIHEVLVTEEGYLYRGQAFKKLSPIAKLITGTPWSGPAFFGTRTVEKKR